MRYTDSRSSPVAQAMLDGIDEDAADFRQTYDGEDREPIVLPARFPNLLANGAAGIAVGMATSIPPHNAGEICAALLHLIAQPKCSTAELVAHLPGPDFPTGGILVEAPESIAEAYATGRGSFRLRARWDKEQLSHGLYQIVVTEIPYQVQKSRLIEKVAALLEEKKLPLLADIRDESASDIRLVLEPKNRNVDADVLMEQLFRASELEVRVPLNLNVVDGAGVPRVMDLKEVLQAFLDHRREVLQRRNRHRLAAVARRMEILRGLVIVYVNLDEVIRIIRESDDPKAEMAARWALTDLQAEAILNMRLRALRRLEEVAIGKELESLGSEASGIEALLASDRRPGGRGQGEPLRLMIDLPNEREIVALFPYRPGLRLLVISDDGRGFLVAGEEALAQTRAGKQVLTPAKGARAAICVPAEGDAAALVGENRRLL